MSSAQEVKLFCYILGKYEAPFPVNIAQSETVGDLKEAIFKKNQAKLVHVDATQLRLWKYYYPAAGSTLENLSTQLDNLQLPNQDSLDDFALFYGSPSTNFGDIKIPMLVAEHQRISLQPVHHDGWSLTSKLDGSLRRTIFKVTAGHVGAIVYFMNFIKQSDVYRQVGNGDNQCITLEQFLEATSYTKFITSLMGPSVFWRGLPREQDLQNPSIAMVFRTVLKYHSVTDQHFNIDERQALQKCFSRGWLHSDLIGHSEKIGYFFPSPLHQTFVESFLNGSRNAVISEATLRDFVVAICHKMSPVNFHARQVGAAYIQRTPEAQYGDEFYRACMDHTEGSIITPSEWINQEGRIDFYLPSRRWGIEILRDGNEIQDNNNRFTYGAYSKWIVGGEMEDYILLDFRQNVPRAKHPETKHLWHVVLQDGLMQLLDNMLERVCDDVTLLSLIS